MSKHTKGPWRTEEAKAGGVPYRLEIRGEENETQPFGPTVATLGWVDEPDICHVHGIEEARANARLMAAAPDMLEALQGMLSMWNSVCTAHAWEPEHLTEVTAARAAIAKAIGE